MRRKTKKLGPFLGLKTSVDSRAIDPVYASAMQNVRIEDGALRVRYGYRNLVAAQAQTIDLFGYIYLQGYNQSTYAEVEEFITWERLVSQSDPVKPYSVHPTTGARTEIKNGVTALNVSATAWNGFAFRDKSYLLNQDETFPVVQHAIGDATSWSLVKTPDAPTTALDYRITYGGDSTPYSSVTYGGIDVATELTYTGAAQATSSALLGGGILQIAHTASTVGESSVEIDFSLASAGVQDWTNNDVFSISLSTNPGVFFVIDQSSVKFTFINNDGTPKEFVPTDSTFAFSSTGAIVFRLAFRNKTRADWDNIKKLKITYTVTQSTSTAARNLLIISPIVKGGIEVIDYAIEHITSFAYTYYFSSGGFESGIAGRLDLQRSLLAGQQVDPGLFGLGVHLELTGTVSADGNVDNIRYYVLEINPATRVQTWRRMGTQADSDLTFDVRTAYWERPGLTAYTPSEFRFSGVKCGCPMKGWVVWGYKGGYQNIRHSQVGNPLGLANSTTDIEDDETRGATFSLADNFGDDPIAMFPAGDALIILGSLGVYAQVGITPSTMTPPKKLPGSIGAKNQFACCRWKDDYGNPGVAYLSREGDSVWFVRVDDGFDGEGNGQQVIEITKDIRGKIRSYLYDEQDLELDTLGHGVRMGVDEAQDALWIIYDARALVWRRPSLIDGQRQWEAYEYNLIEPTSYINYIAFTSKYRMRWQRRTGELDEVEWNSSTNAWITGALKDSTGARPSIYWESKTINGPNRRIDLVTVDKDTAADTPTITVTSDRQTTSKTLTTLKRGIRFGMLQQGWNHKFKIALQDAGGPIRQLTWDEIPLDKRVQA